MNVYFDNSATTKPYDEVIEAVSKGMKEYFGNPSSLHKIGMNCEKRLNEAREYFASTIKCNKEEIYFTSGGSEGNNLILKGLLKPGHHFITTAFEHHSIISTCKQLEEKGVKVTYLDVDSEGDIEAIGKLIKERSSRAKFHVDAVQGYGKLPIDVNKSNVDFLTVASHKIHGPKGVGFIYIKKGIILNSLISGGSQEKGIRAGTENLPGIIGFEKAAQMTFEEMESRYDKVLELKKYFVERLNEIKDIRVNGEIDGFSPYILNVSFLGVRAEVLLHLLEEQNIYVATGSACTSKSSAAHGSYVIKSLGLSNKEVESAIRFSFSYENTKEEVDYTIDVLKKSLMFLRRVKR